MAQKQNPKEPKSNLKHLSTRPISVSLFQKMLILWPLFLKMNGNTETARLTKSNTFQRPTMVFFTCRDKIKLLWKNIFESKMTPNPGITPLPFSLDSNSGLPCPLPCWNRGYIIGPTIFLTYWPFFTVGQDLCFAALPSLTGSTKIWPNWELWVKGKPFLEWKILCNPTTLFLNYFFYFYKETPCITDKILRYTTSLAQLEFSYYYGEQFFVRIL